MILLPPSITFQGRDWSGETLAVMAAGWHARVVERLPAAPDAVAVVARSHPETFALLFALTRPANVNIDEVVVTALAQSSGARIIRD